MNYLALAQFPLLFALIYIFTAYMTRTFPILTGKRICLLIAHPDDEAMFFAPILQTLSHPSLGNQIVILCLSSGDADGLGHTRKEELAKSALQLGLRTSEHVVVIEDTKNFPDSMTQNWSSKAISDQLRKFFATDLGPKDAAPKTNIDAIITFDQGGVSGHPNHISLYHGATTFLRSIMSGRSGWECPVKLYTLTTTNVVRKYSSIVDVAVTIVCCLFRRKEKGEFPTPLLAISLPGDVRKAQLAMTTAHKSQMRWFRWGWIGISRYMVMNDLVKQKGF